MKQKKFLFFVLLTVWSVLHASCPTTTPWTTPVQLSNSGGITSNVFSAATSAGFMAAWADSANNAHYSFSSDGVNWQSDVIISGTKVATNSDVFVAGNDSGFMLAWVDVNNNAWSTFSANNGKSWSAEIKINPNSLALDPNSDVYIAGGSSGFVAAIIGSDDNAYASFSSGNSAWSTLAQVTSDGSVTPANQNSVTGRGFVSVAVAGNSCMLSWLNNIDPTYSAYFSSINPFSSTTPYPIINVGFVESASIVAELNGYFMAVARVNQGSGQTYFATATIPTNWALFSAFTTNPVAPFTGPWVAANHAGFLTSWVVGAGNGSPVWTLTANNGFNQTPVCSILTNQSTTIAGPVGLSANNQGFVATWLDTADLNAYASFYWTPETNSGNLFVGDLQQKYGPLL